MAIPPANTLTVLMDVKFSLLILQRSERALFVELIKLMDFSFDKNLLISLNENLGSCIFLFAEIIKIKNQNAKVGIVTRITKLPMK